MMSTAKFAVVGGAGELPQERVDADVDSRVAHSTAK